MRKTLLIAAATLAASVISSQAGVYSQNIVGYANVTTLGFKNNMISCPFTIGASNGLNEIFGTSLPQYSYVLIYTNANYVTATYDNQNIPGTYWYNADESVAYDGIGGDPGIPCLPPGVGFFLYVAGPTMTNTFAGAVAISVGTSNNMVLNPYHNNAVASVVPYAGPVTNGNNSTGGPNIDVTTFPQYSYFLFHNDSAGSYNTAVFDNQNIPGTYWYNADESANYVDPVTGQNTPSIAVGQGFFIYPAGAYTWTTGL